MIRTLAILTLFAVLIGASKAQQSDAPPVDGKLSEIGDVTIVADTDKLIAQAQQQMSDISKDVDAKERANEFKTIRSLRLRLNKRSLELRALLESFRQYKLSQTSQLQQKQNSMQNNTSNKLQAGLLNVEEERAKQQIDKSKTDLEALKSQLASAGDDTMKRELADQIAKNTLDIREREAQIPLYEQKKIELTEGSATSKKEVDDLNNTLAKVDSVLSRAQTTLRNLDETLVEIDEQSNSLLQTDILSINYTDRSTYIFAILVGAVIIGFFGIAFRSDKVRDAIFTGESGIQFVTLFSLVIAIILFGVLKILEGKELAALLGGLSGYILGRGSHVQGEVSPSAKDPKTPS